MRHTRRPPAPTPPTRPARPLAPAGHLQDFPEESEWAPSAELLNRAVGRELRLGEDAVLFVHRKCVPCKPLEKRTSVDRLAEGTVRR